MVKWIACQVCGEMTTEPIAVRARRPDTLAYVEAPTCGSAGCARVFAASLAELAPADAPRVAVEVEYSEG